MEKLTEQQVKLIVNNVVRACQDINKLNNTGYKFLYVASGFIAHYNLSGFIDYYSQNSLKADIIEHMYMNRWENFSPGDRDYEYYHQKADIYKKIIEGITVSGESLEMQTLKEDLKILSIKINNTNEILDGLTHQRAFLIREIDTLECVDGKSLLGVKVD